MARAAAEPAAAPALDHLRLYHRDGVFIVFNPTVPCWVHTNATGALLLRLLSETGDRAVATRIGATHGIARASIDSFYATCREERLFEVVPPEGAAMADVAWTARRIGSVYLHLTNRCNLSCAYCYRNSSPRIAIKHFGPEFIAFLEDAGPLIDDAATITFSGGEPMVHPDFFGVARYTAGRGWTNALLTNGTFIDEQTVDEVLRLFRNIKISLDGASEDTHSATRGAGNFDRVLGAVRLLAERAVDTAVRVQMTVTAGNLGEAKAVRDLIPPNVQLRFTPMLPMGRAKVEPEEARISTSEFYGVHELVQSFDDKGVTHLNQGVRTHGCSAGDRHISVADTGDVYPCHHFHKRAFRLGNIFTDPADDILFGESIRAFAGTMDVESNNPRCGACDFRYLCGGGCKANPLHAIGDHRASDTFCGFIRQSLLDQMFQGDPAALRPQSCHILERST